MADSFWSIITFVIGLIISTIIIYIITKIFGQKEGIKQAFLTAIIGSIVYSIFLLGHGFWAAIAGGFVWLTLKALYNIDSKTFLYGIQLNFAECSLKYRK